MKKRKKDDTEKRAEYMAQFKHKCKCGANVYLSKKYPKKICKWCGKTNYLDDKERFKDKLVITLKKHKYML